MSGRMAQKPVEALLEHTNSPTLAWAPPSEAKRANGNREVDRRSGHRRIWLCSSSQAPIGKRVRVTRSTVVI